MSSRPTEATNRLVEWIRQLRESSTMTSPVVEMPSTVFWAMPQTATQAPTSLHEAASGMTTALSVRSMMA
ncbi:hypothetical protein G6F52_014239 [Rhizopus delemar]|nr:hypothetical protein G6F52_014239 [Rhizopus delemar]